MPRPPRTAITTAVLVATLLLSAVGPGFIAPTATASASQSVATDLHDRGLSTERNISVTVWRVPGYVDVLNASADDLRAHLDGNATPAVVTEYDHLAIELSLPGLDDRAANASGNRTERVLAALKASGHFSIRQTLETTGVESRPASLWLNASTVRAVDAGNDRYVLVVDPEETLATRVGELAGPAALADAYANDPDRFSGLYKHGGRAYVARYYENDSWRGLVAKSEPVRFSLASVDLDVAGPLVPVANATVVGSTTLHPGTKLEVVARNDAAGVATTDVVTVDENGTFEAMLDLPPVDAPTTVTFTAAVASDYAADVRVQRSIVRVLEPRATVTFDDQTTTTRYVSARANLTHGGVLVLRNESEIVDSTTTLAPDTNQTVTFSLPTNATAGTYEVVAYRGTASDRGNRYPNGTASASISFATDTLESTTTTRTTTRSTTTAPLTPRSSTTTSSLAADTTTNDAIPGFGVAIALAALLTVAVFRRTSR